MSKDDTEHKSVTDSHAVASAASREKNMEAGDAPTHHTSAYEEYLYGRSIFSSYQLKPNWSSTTNGRMAIRLVSRGIFGALAYAFATRYASNQLRNYEPDTFKWGEVSFTEKPLQYVAKVWDVAAGKPIEKFVRFMAPAGKGGSSKDAWAYNAVRFRPKAYFHDVAGKPVGRSLGAEVVVVTFDFSAMSLGDAIARNTIQAFDPNMPQPWFVDKDGHAATREHGTFSAKKWGQAVIRATWRSVTKNAGEDWAAALPYVYQMKWQREALSKIPAFSGFKNSWDRNRNGGALIINRDGKIVGDHQLAGIIDLQGRFVGYNVYTLMYREFYDYLSRNLWHVYKHGIHLSDFHMPEKPLDAVVDAFGFSTRYLLKSAIKANLFMQPAVPFFWLFRTPQSKWKSEIILQGAAPSQNPIGTWAEQAAGKEDPYRKGVYRFDYPLKYSDWVRPTKGLTGKERPDKLWFGHEQVPFPKSLKEKGPYHFDNCPTLTSKLLNPFGWISYQTGTGLSLLAEKVAPTGSRLSQIIAGTKNIESIPLERTLLMRNWGDAAWSYTPYFIAKDEFGLRVNDSPATGELGKMDKAIYGLIDNMFTFRFNKAGKSVKDIWNLSTEDLKKENVIHYEGKHVVKDDDTHPVVPPPKPPQIPAGPTTKVQATTVQYTTSPPTHLKHQTAAEAALNNPQSFAPTEAPHWVDTMAERQQKPGDPQPRHTIH